MKTKQLLISFIAVVIAGGLSLFMLNDVDDNFVDYKYQVRLNSSIDDARYGAHDAEEWINARRVNPATGEISARDLERSRQAFAANSANRNANTGSQNWAFMGPDNVGGRTRAFLVDNQNTSTLWAGGVSGGLWRSINEGQSWIPIELENMDNISISSICQDPDGTIYVGTGEIRGTSFRGNGIYKSTDRQTFTLLEGTTNPNQFGFVNELICDPNTGDLYAACSGSGVTQGLTGIFKSTDKGATWTRPFDAYGTKGKGNASDVAISSNGTLVYAIHELQGTYKVYVSVNGGEPVSKASDFADDGDTYNRIEFAISPSNANYMYALCSYDRNVEAKWFNLYRSTDGGNSWNSVLLNHTPSVNPFGENKQGDYDNVIAVYPNDPNRVVFGGVDLWEWKEGNAFEQVSFWQEYASFKFVHADQHVIYFHPDYANNQTIYFCNDGGIFRGTQTVAYQALNKNYNVTQYYGIDCGPKGEVLGGTQDNGTQYLDLLTTVNPNTAREFTGGDGGYSAISELYPGAIFSTIYHSQLIRSNENGAEATRQRNPFDITGSNSTYNSLSPGNDRNPFITPIDMWESFNDDNSKLYHQYIVQEVIHIGNDGIPDTTKYFLEDDVLLIESMVVEPRSFEYKITAEDIANSTNDTINVGDTLAIREPFSSLMAIGGAGANNTSDKLYITRNILDFKDAHPKWDAICGPNNINADLKINSVSNVKWAPDGATLYALANYKDESGGNTHYYNGLFRFTGINDYYHLTQRVNGIITDVPVPTYSNRIITNDTTRGIYSRDINSITLLSDNPINVWSIVYNDGNSTVTNNNVIEVDTVDSNPMMDLYEKPFNECDTVIVHDISFYEIASVKDSIHSDTIFSLNIGSETYNYILNIDTIATPNISLKSFTDDFCNYEINNIDSTGLNIVATTFDTIVDSVYTSVNNYSKVFTTDTTYLSFTSYDLIRKQIIDGACVKDTIFNVSEDSISAINSYSNTIDLSYVVLNTGAVHDSIIKFDTIQFAPDTIINLISLNWLTCSNDTIFSIDKDSITSMIPQSFNINLDSVYTASINYNNIIDYDTNFNVLDTIFTIHQKDPISGLCTELDIRKENIDHYSSYNYQISCDSVYSDAGNFSRVVDVDTMSVLNITYKDTANGSCNIMSLTGISNDTISNLVSTIINTTYKEIHLNNGDVYYNLIHIDTTGLDNTVDFVAQDTTYQMGEEGDDMVWHETSVNTTSQIDGQLIKTFNYATPTSITVDKKDVNKLVVTVGGFGEHNKIFYSEDVLAETPVFVSIDGTGLAEEPVYASLFSDTIAENAQNLLIIGTEYGVYSTSNLNGASTQWTRESSMPKAAVFHLAQQQNPNGYLPGICNTGVENSGAIYAGTHGIGVWKMDLYQRPYTGIQEISSEKPDALRVKVYPNPVRNIANVEYSVTETSDVVISVYSLTGKLVYKKNIKNQYQGTYTHQINSEGMTKGVYILSLTSNDERKVSKFIVE